MHCGHCGRKLIPIGSSRKNGGTTTDWEKRKFHKKCWLIQQHYQHWLINN